MGQSLVQNYIHVIFSTKNRMRYIKEERQGEIFKYLGSLCNEKKCQVIKVGGYDDHIYILCLLNKNIALAELVKFIKSYSSKWIKNRFPEIEFFTWQEGYSSFSINPNQVNDVVQYIENQKVHHARKPFEDELIYFLKKYNQTYNEQYLWD